MLAGVRASGLKLTAQRLAIVREIASDPTHPTAQELYERLLPSMPTMSFATVYNTLDALAVAGLCSARALSPGASRFDPNMVPHDHAVCDLCGLVRDVTSHREVDRPWGAIVRDLPSGARSHAGVGVGKSRGSVPIPGFSVHAVEQIYRGVCADCEKKRGPKARQVDSPPSKKRTEPTSGGSAKRASAGPQRKLTKG